MESMKTCLLIKGQLPGLNEYTKENRAHRIAGAKMKEDAERYITVFIKNQHLKPIPGRVHLIFRWFEPNNKRDPDNVAFAKKFILDALVANRIIEGDGRKYIHGFEDYIETDNKNPRIEVEISSLEC